MIVYLQKEFYWSQHYILRSSIKNSFRSRQPRVYKHTLLASNSEILHPNKYVPTSPKLTTLRVGLRQKLLRRCFTRLVIYLCYRYFKINPLRIHRWNWESLWSFGMHLIGSHRLIHIWCFNKPLTSAVGLVFVPKGNESLWFIHLEVTHFLDNDIKIEE